MADTPSFEGEGTVAQCPVCGSVDVAYRGDLKSSEDMRIVAQDVQCEDCLSTGAHRWLLQARAMDPGGTTFSCAYVFDGWHCVTPTERGLAHAFDRAGG